MFSSCISIAIDSSFLQYIATPPPFHVFRASKTSCKTKTDTLPPDFSILSRNIFNSSNVDGRL